MLTGDSAKPPTLLNAEGDAVPCMGVCVRCGCCVGAQPCCHGSGWRGCLLQLHGHQSYICVCMLPVMHPAGLVGTTAVAAAAAAGAGGGGAAVESALKPCAAAKAAAAPKGHLPASPAKILLSCATGLLGLEH